MKDLISREALAKEIHQMTIICLETYSIDDYANAVAGIIEDAPAVDAVEVVLCKNCILHGSCLTEDTFKIARIENPYCCGGKRKMET